MPNPRSGGVEMKIWFCKIGETQKNSEGPGDPPMRQAVADAYHSLTGQPPNFLFSGWGGSLTKAERAVVAWWRDAD